MGNKRNAEWGIKVEEKLKGREAEMPTYKGKGNK